MARAFEPSSLYSLLFLPHQWSPVQPHPGTISSNNILPSIWEGLDCGSQVECLPRIWEISGFHPQLCTKVQHILKREE